MPAMQWLCMSGKKNITRGLGKIILTPKPNHPYHPPPPQKPNGRPLKNLQIILCSTVKDFIPKKNLE